MDLSSPHGKSVNDAINSDLCSLKYTTKGTSIGSRCTTGKNRFEECVPHDPRDGDQHLETAVETSNPLSNLYVQKNVDYFLFMGPPTTNEVDRSLRLALQLKFPVTTDKTMGPTCRSLTTP